jgi:preprotein translocase subunit SecE
MEKIRNFLSGVKKEVERVRWPDKKSMFKYSIATVGFVIFFALFFYVTDIVVAFIKTIIN